MSIIVFDLVGTLLTNEKNNYNVALKWLANNYFQNKYSDLLNASSIFKSKYLAERGRSYVETSFFEQLSFFEELMQVRITGDFKYIEEQFVKICRNEKLMTGANELLDFLHEKGHPMFVLTNSLFSGDSLKQYLSLLRIGRYFKKIYSSADIGFRKPSKNVFNFVINDINKSFSDKIIYVGDSYEKDYLGACKCGLFPILISKNTDAFICSFNDLNSLLNCFKGMK
ncbi:HAD family hydrolase [Selenomonas sp. AB3002]|uniref:HAD family hydrolase n=1 Tax=Selenomonas sp. AB3002 TaxID=1392502 RepID=UPI0004961F00